MIESSWSITESPKIFLDCNGTEINSSISKGMKERERYSSIVTRAITLNKENKIVKNGSLLIGVDKKSFVGEIQERYESTINTWIINIENGNNNERREIYGEYYTDVVYNIMTIFSSGVSVSDTQIYASKTINYYDRDVKSKEPPTFSEYTLQVNRLNGSFVEMYKSGPKNERIGYTFITETKGTCKKVEQKF